MSVMDMFMLLYIGICLATVICDSLKLKRVYKVLRIIVYIYSIVALIFYVLLKNNMLVQ